MLMSNTMINIIFLRNIPDLFYKIFILIKLYNCILTRSSESDGRSDVTDSLDCPDKVRLPW